MILKILLPLAVFLALLQTSYQLNNRPILGVLLQEKGPNHQYVAASYVKWLESAGARVVPIFVNQPLSYYHRLVNQINGILMPGGGTPLLHTNYSQTADLLLDLAIAKNNASGIYFPVWGTCLSFQKIVTYFTGNSLAWASRCEADDISLKLELPPGLLPNETKLYHDGGQMIIDLVTTHNIAAHYHISCLSTEYFFKTKNLTDQFKVVATNTIHGVNSVTMMEHRHWPIYASVWHPEKNQFEWVVGAGVGHINHDFNAIQVGQYFANFLVNEARKNEQKFDNLTEEAEALMYNYQQYRVYEGKEVDGYFSEIYLFPFGGVP